MPMMGGLGQQQLPSPDMSQVQLLQSMPQEYVLSTTPDDRVQHAYLLAAFRLEMPGAQQVHISWAQTGNGFCNVWLVFQDRRGSLGAITSALSDLGVDISRAAAFSTHDGVAVDAFRVNQFDDELSSALRTRLAAVCAGPMEPSAAELVNSELSRMREQLAAARQAAAAPASMGGGLNSPSLVGVGVGLSAGLGAGLGGGMGGGLGGGMGGGMGQGGAGVPSRPAGGFLQQRTRSYVEGAEEASALPGDWASLAPLPVAPPAAGPLYPPPSPSSFGGSSVGTEPTDAPKAALGDLGGILKLGDFNMEDVITMLEEQARDCPLIALGWPA